MNAEYQDSLPAKFQGALKKGLIGGAAGLGIAVLVGGGVYNIDSNETGVLTQGGEVMTYVEPGWHLKLPIVQGVVKYPADVQVLPVEKTSVYTVDRQEIFADFAMQFQLPRDKDIEGIHKNLQAYRSVLEKEILQASKVVLGGYNTLEIPQKRDEITSKILSGIQKSIADKGYNLRIVGLQFPNFEFSQGFKDGVAAAADLKNKETAAQTELAVVKVNIQKEIAAAERDAKIAVTQSTAAAEQRRLAADAEAYQTEARANALAKAAEAEATAIRTKSTAEAEAITNIGKAEAEKAKLVGTALTENPNLVAMETAKRWDGDIPIQIGGGGQNNGGGLFGYFNALDAVALAKSLEKDKIVAPAPAAPPALEGPH